MEGGTMTPPGACRLLSPGTAACQCLREASGWEAEYFGTKEVLDRSPVGEGGGIIWSSLHTGIWGLLAA